MRWPWTKKHKVPPKVEALVVKANETKQYVDIAAQRAATRQRDVSELAAWLEWRRAENHLSPLLFPTKGKKS